MKKGMLIAAGVLVALWVAGIISANVFDSDPMEWFSGKKDAASAAVVEPKAGAEEEDWKTYSYPEFKFSIDSPVTLTDKKPEIDTAKMTGGKFSMNSISIVGVQLLPEALTIITSITEIQGLPSSLSQMDLKSQLEKVFSGLGASGTYKPFQADVQPVTWPGATGVLGVGTTENEKGRPIKMQIFLARQGDLTVNAMFAYSGSEKNDAVVERMLRSIKFPL